MTNSQDHMTLSIDNVTERVRRTSINWVLAMQKEYGQEMGLKCFDIMRQTFGEDLVGAVLFGIMEGKNRSNEVTIKWNGDPNRRVIETIKEIRFLTGFGLKEAKDVVDAALTRESTFVLSYDMQKPEHSDRLERSIQTIEQCGFVVY